MKTDPLDNMPLHEGRPSADRTIEEKDEAARPSFLEVVGFLACGLAVVLAVGSLLSWVDGKVNGGDFCYYEIKTQSVSISTGDAVYKRVFVDCPKGL